MMAIRIFAENEKRDIFMGSNKRISIIDGKSAVAQAAKSAVEIQLGEAIYNTVRGVPSDRAVWSGTPDLQQFEFYARRQILSVPDVLEVTFFNAEMVGDELQYQATIKTTFGEGQINGSV